MEVVRDPAPVSVGSGHRALHQTVPLALPIAHVPGQLPGKREEPQLEQDQAAEHAGQQAEQQTAAALGHSLVPDAVLEQQRLLAASVDPEVDLEELAEAALVLVLG